MRIKCVPTNKDNIITIKPKEGKINELIMEFEGGTIIFHVDKFYAEDLKAILNTWVTFIGLDIETEVDIS